MIQSLYKVSSLKIHTHHINTTSLRKDSLLPLFYRMNANHILYLGHYSHSNVGFSIKKNELLYSLKNKMNASSFTFFSSLFLGNKTNSFHYEKLKDHFKRWGLSHYLARSGLHLILFIALWQFLLRFIPLAFIIKHLILSCIVVLYFIFSWPSLPFIRSCITYFVYFIYILCNKQIDSLHILTLVTWLILLSNPVQLFSLDFQLSFGLTFALIWFSRLQRVQTKNRTTSHKINPITNLEFIQKH